MFAFCDFSVTIDASDGVDILEMMIDNFFTT